MRKLYKNDIIKGIRAVSGPVIYFIIEGEDIVSLGVGAHDRAIGLLEGENYSMIRFPSMEALNKDLPYYKSFVIEGRRLQEVCNPEPIVEVKLQKVRNKKVVRLTAKIIPERLKDFGNTTKIDLKEGARIRRMEVLARNLKK